MLFLNGILVGFVALGSIPIIIHLLNRSRFKIVQWAAMEFLLRTLQKNSRRIQFRDLILMLLRTAAIVLVALAMARPTLAPGKLIGLAGAGAGVVTAVVVVDHSLSMATRDVNDSRFEIAQRTAKAIIDQLPRGSAATVVNMSDIASAEVVEPTRDLAFLSESLTRSQVSDGGTSLLAGMQAAWQIIKDLPPEGREIHLVTDLQARGWPKPDDRAWVDLKQQLTAARDLRIFVADVGAPAPANVSVENLAFADDLVGTDGPSTLIVSLRNHAPTPAGNVAVELLVDDGKGGELRPVANAVVDSLVGATQVRLATGFASGGRHRVEVRIGPDALLADNARRLIVDVVDTVKVLVVDGAATDSGPSGATFLRAALSPAALLGGGDAAEVRTDRIAVTVVAPAALAGMALDDYRAVIISDLADPDERLADGLRQFVSSGKGLILFLGGNVRSEAWNRVFGGRGLLPGTLGATPRELADPQDATRKAGIGFATTELSHPIVAFFSDPANQQYLGQPRIRKAWPLTVLAPAAGAIGAVVAARFTDGTPAITSLALGRGEVLAFAIPADKAWSDLPLRPAFLMLMQRAVQHAALGSRPRLSVAVHDTIGQTIPARDSGVRFAATDPRGGESPILPVVGADGQTRIERSDTPFAGFYTFANGADVHHFAVNPPAEESDLTVLAKDAAQAVLDGLTVSWVGGGEDGASAADEGKRIGRSRTGRELWPILLMVAIACLLTESVLALSWAPKST